MQHGLFFFFSKKKSKFPKIRSKKNRRSSHRSARNRRPSLSRPSSSPFPQFHRLRISTRTTLAQLLTEAHSHGRRERFPTVYPLRFAPAGFVNRRSTSRRIGSGGTCRDRSRNSRERERWSRGDNTVKTYGQLQAAEIRACPFSSKGSIEEGVVFPIV